MVALLALLVALGVASYAAAQDDSPAPPPAVLPAGPGIDPDTALLVQALRELNRAQSGGSGTELATPISVVITALLGLGGLAKIAPQIGASRDERTVEALARIEAKIDQHHEEIAKLRELRHELPNLLQPLTTEVALLRDQVERLERDRGDPPERSRR